MNIVKSNSISKGTSELLKRDILKEDDIFFFISTIYFEPEIKLYPKFQDQTYIAFQSNSCICFL